MYNSYSRSFSATSSAHYSVHSRSKKSANKNKNNYSSFDDAGTIFISVYYVVFT